MTPEEALAKEDAEEALLAKTPVTNLRCELVRPGRIGYDDKWVKPVYQMKFTVGDRNCCRPITNNGERRPLGQDCIDAMESYIEQGRCTAEQVLEAPIRD